MSPGVASTILERHYNRHNRRRKRERMKDNRTKTIGISDSDASRLSDFRCGEVIKLVTTRIPRFVSICSLVPTVTFGELAPAIKRAISHRAPCGR